MNGEGLKYLKLWFFFNGFVQISCFCFIQTAASLVQISGWSVETLSQEGPFISFHLHKVFWRKQFNQQQRAGVYVSDFINRAVSSAEQ